MIDNYIHKVAEEQAERVEKEVQDAILDDYDGIDIRYEVGQIGIASMEKWRGTPPLTKEGYRTVRYTWEWFDNERLKEAIENDNVLELIDDA